MKLRADIASGYTLIEVLVVLAIIGLIAGFAMPPAARTIEFAFLQSDARSVVSQLRSARDEAIDQGTTVTFERSPEGYIDIGGKDRLVLSHGSKLELDAKAIAFYPDGTSNGGALEVSRADRALRINVSWLTGTISVVSP